MAGSFNTNSVLTVTVSGLDIARNPFGLLAEGATNGTPNSVPEPSSLALVVLAGLTLLRSRRRPASATLA